MNSKADLNRKWKRRVVNDLKRLKRSLKPHLKFSKPFTIAEIEAAIIKLKCGKAAGPDMLFPEFIKNFGVKAKLCLLGFFNKILSSSKLPSVFKKSKVIGICKPGKSGDDAAHFRPICLLCVIYKILERMILDRIQHTIDEIIPVE